MGFSYAAVRNIDGHIDMMVRFDSEQERDRVMNDGLHGNYEPTTEEAAYDFYGEHNARWAGPFTYYGGTPLDGISFYHTIYE